jgi:hypothetical protein
MDRELHPRDQVCTALVGWAGRSRPTARRRARSTDTTSPACTRSTANDRGSAATGAGGFPAAVSGSTVTSTRIRTATSPVCRVPRISWFTVPTDNETFEHLSRPRDAVERAAPLIPCSRTPRRAAGSGPRGTCRRFRCGRAASQGAVMTGMTGRWLVLAGGVRPEQGGATGGAAGALPRPEGVGPCTHVPPRSVGVRSLLRTELRSAGTRCFPCAGTCPAAWGFP